VWSFDGGEQSGFGFWVSLVFGCGVLMEQTDGFWVFGFLFQFAPLPSDLLSSLSLFLFPLLLLLLLCVCDAFWRRSGGRGREGF